MKTMVRYVIRYNDDGGNFQYQGHRLWRFTPDIKKAKFYSRYGDATSVGNAVVTRKFCSWTTYQIVPIDCIIPTSEIKD